MKLSHILTSIVITVFLSGCHSSKKATEQSSSIIGSETSFAGVLNRHSAWTDIEVPISIDISSPVNFNISGRAKMINGKSVDISLRMLGFEVGRLYINADSVFGYIKMSKTGIAESLGDLTAQIPINISNVQELLTGGLFLLGKTSLSDANEHDFIIEKEDGGVVMTPRKQSDKFQYGFFVNNNIIRFVGGNDEKNIQCAYSGYSANTHNYPAEVDVKVSLSRPVVASINWRWESAKWNTGLSSQFSMPNGYKKVRSQEILNHLPK